MATFKGSQTEKNILTAFCGESQARNKYTFFAKQAKKEGYVQISAIFEQTANHERAHAKQLFKLLEGGEAEITATFPAGVIGTTLENLQEAAGGEKYEHETMYPEFARVAREEGFDKAASVMENIGKAEVMHEARYRALIANIENESVFTKEESKKWMCSNCGWTHEGPEAPGSCSACSHPQAYFEVYANNY